jgi:PAS domain S-box-containing protein
MGDEGGVGRQASASRAERGVELYRDMLEMAEAGAVLIDAEGRIAEVNERMCALVGKPREALLGRSAAAAPGLPERIASQAAEVLARLRAEGRDERELKLPGADGRELILEMRARRAPDGSFRAIFRDVTEARKAEEQLRLKSMFLEAVANSSADGILVVDPRGKKILQNARTIELWKIPADVVEDPSGDRQVAHVMAYTTDPGKFLAEIEHQKRSPMEVTNDQLELVDGTVLDRHSAPVLGRDGLIYGRVYTFHDVTGFRRAEERIRGLLEEKDTILREAHHRVKNYMSTLQAILSLHARTLEEPSAISALGDAQLRVEGMLTLYDKLYVQAGSGSTVASIYMRELVEEIMANFPRTAEVTLEQRFDDFALDGRTMRTLGIIVNELLTNIMKYAFEGRDSGKIGVSLVLSDGKAELEVRDDGVGFRDDAQGKGIGFGLMLVDTLVRQLDGTMRVERGGGTRYSIVFDAAGLVRP